VPRASCCAIAASCHSGLLTQREPALTKAIVNIDYVTIRARRLSLGCAGDQANRLINAGRGPLPEFGFQSLVRVSRSETYRLKDKRKTGQTSTRASAKAAVWHRTWVGQIYFGETSSCGSGFSRR